MMRKSQRVDTILRRDRDDDISNASTSRGAYNKKRKGNPIAVPIQIPGQYNNSRIAGMHTSNQSSSGRTIRNFNRPSKTLPQYNSSSTFIVRDLSSSTSSAAATSTTAFTYRTEEESVKRRRLRQNSNTPPANSTPQRQAPKEVIEIDDSDEDSTRKDEQEDEIMLVKEPTIIIPIEGHRVHSTGPSSSFFTTSKSPVAATSKSLPCPTHNPNTDSSAKKLNADNKLYTPKKRKIYQTPAISHKSIKVFSKTASAKQPQLFHSTEHCEPDNNDSTERRVVNKSKQTNSAVSSLATEAPDGKRTNMKEQQCFLSPSSATARPLSLVQSSSLILEHRSAESNCSLETSTKHTPHNSVPEYTSNILNAWNKKRPRSLEQDGKLEFKPPKEDDGLMLKSRIMRHDHQNIYDGNCIIKKKGRSSSSLPLIQYKVDTVSHATNNTASSSAIQDQWDYEKFLSTQYPTDPATPLITTERKSRKEGRTANNGFGDADGDTSGSSDKGYTTAPASPSSAATSSPKSDNSMRKGAKTKQLEHDPIDDYKIEPIGADEHYLSYPFTKKKAITVFECDYERLNEENYLNDTLIDIFPKIWHDSYAEQSDKIHTFSSFFFTKLHTRYGHIDYEKVHRWTSKLDIFKKRLLIVPVNQNNHWFLIAVLNPGYCIRGERGLKDYNNPIIETGDNTIDATTTTTKKSAQRKNLAAGQSLDSRKPYIITLDPLSLNKQATARAVCSYLKLEAKTKLGLDEKDFLEPQYVMVSCPGQKNYTDCGVFCLHYIQSMYAKTDRMIEALYENPRKYGDIWDEDGTLPFYREYLKRTLKRKMQEYRDHLLQSMFTDPQNNTYVHE